MNNSVLFKTKSGGLYCHSIKKNQFFLNHPVMDFLIKLDQQKIDLRKWLENQNSDSIEVENYGFFTKDEVEYYYKKFLMLNENGYFAPIEFKKRTSGRLNPYTVESNLANTMQVTIEVTDACNLKCEYCGYGKFYQNYDKRENKDLSFLIAKNLLDYLILLWNSPLNKSHERDINIGFYGGEPLLNFPLIKEIVKYLSELKMKHNRFKFSVTTNGLLLEKYMNFLVKNNFTVNISLDGNIKHNAYRVFHNGESAFKIIYKNILTFRENFPDYFEKKIHFLSVLHNKNSVSDILKYFKKNFGKTSDISEVNPFGIAPEMREEFRKTYQNFRESLEQAEDYSAIQKDIFNKIPDVKSTMETIFQYGGYFFKKFNDFIFSDENKSYIPTGTCLPFDRKVFLTVNGKILPCERIGHQFSLGYVNESKVEINYQDVADKYNYYFEKMTKKCSACFNTKNCRQCLFYLNIMDENPVCQGFMGKEELSNFFASRISYLEEHPEIYFKYINETTAM